MSDVQFPGDINRAPKAHVPGQPAMRVEGQVLADPNAADVGAASGVMYTSKASNNPNTGVQVLKINPDAILPQLGSNQAAGYDLATPAAVTLKAGERTTIPLGFAMELPAGLHGRIESRSGLALKGMVVLTGVIDADYRGEVKVIMQNFSNAAHEFAAGDRVAQLVLRPTVHVPFTPVEELTSTTRGVGGFGSTGQ